MPFISSNVSVTFSDTNKVDSNLVDSGEDFLSVFPGSLVLGQVDNVSSIGALTLESSGSGVLTLSAVTNSSSVGGLTLTDGSGVTFSVADYGGGADPTGVADSTAAIQATIDAASAVASVSTPATVLFPPGTYKIIPPGRARATIYRKTSGVWGSALATDINTDQVVDTNFHYMSATPTSGDGADGDVAFNSRKGLFYKKAAGSWSLTGKMMDGSGDGWICQYSATDLYPAYKVIPDNAEGQDGDFAVMYRMQFDNQGLACFLVKPENSYITFQGSGVGSTKLLLRCFSDEDPAGYTVDVPTKTVLTSRIPGSMRTDYNKGSYNHARGSAFVMKALSTETITNVKWDGIWIEGGTVANGGHGYYTEYDSAHEWDQGNKGIVFTWDQGTIVGAEVTNCKLTGFRGEVLYKGGANSAQVLIEDTEISESNGSAVSISGTTTMNRCTITNSYNGVENFCLGTQSVSINDCTIDLDAGTWRGEFGIVYLGVTTASMTVDGCEIGGAVFSDIFLADAAENVTIQNCILRDAQWGIYAYYQNQYGKGLPINFSNVTISGNNFKASARNMSHPIYVANQGSVPAANWVVDSNTLTEVGYWIGHFIRDRIDGQSNHDITVSNSDLTAANTLIYPEDAVAPYTAALTYNYNIVFSYTVYTSDVSFFVNTPKIKIVHTGALNSGRDPEPGYPQNWNANFTPANLYNGYRVEIWYKPDGDKLNTVVLPSAAWNTWVSDIVLTDGDSVTMEFSSVTGKFSLVP